MSKSRTKPTHEQARYLHEYFEALLGSFSRYRASMTGEQRDIAYTEFKRLDVFRETLATDILEWSQKHVTSNSYSNAIRAANKRMARVNKPPKSVKSTMKTTMEVSRSNKNRLEMIKEENGLSSLDEVVTMLVELEREIRYRG